MKNNAAVRLFRGLLIALAIAIPFALIGSTASSESTKLVIAPDLAQRLAKFKKVHMPFDSSALTAREKQMVDKLVDASGLLDCIYWRQSDPEGLKLYLSLAHTTNPQFQMLAEYLKINGGRFDLIDDNKPFVYGKPSFPGAGFFPSADRPDAALAQIRDFIEHEPNQRAAIYSPYTIVLGLVAGSQNKAPAYKGPDALHAIPYHVEFAEFLKPMAADLRAAADLSDDPAFANFLRLRADALLTDDYYKSDIAWLDLKDPKFDVIFAPYEVYLDGLLGVKTSYGASVMIRNDAESKKVEVFQKYVPELQESLALPAADLPSKHGKQSPMEVVDGVYRAGDLLHGYQAVADNLPNDPRIHEEKGSKKMFWQNFMDARVNYIILPLAKQLMRPDQARMASTEGLMDFVILHEVSHGLGPSFAHTTAGKVGVGEAIGPQYSSLEESKADVTSMHDVKWLVDRGVIPKSKLDGIYASYLAETFRTIRFGIAEAHGQGSMMQLSYLTEQGAIRRDPATGRYEVDFAKFPAAIESLDKELLEQEATGDRARAEAWFKKYAVMPPELTAALAKCSNVPVDVDPEFDFHPPLR